MINDIPVSYKTVYMGVNRWAHAPFTSMKCQNNNNPDSILVSCICAGAGAVIALIFSVSSGYSPHGNPCRNYLGQFMPNQSFYHILFCCPQLSMIFMNFHTFPWPPSGWLVTCFTYLQIPPTQYTAGDLLGLMRPYITVVRPETIYGMYT